MHIGLLGVLIMRLIELEVEGEELQERSGLPFLVDQAASALETILEQIHHFEVHQNQAGECYGVQSSDLLNALLTMYQFAVAVRGTSEDYYYLASVESRIADAINDNKEALPYYRSAVQHARIGKKAAGGQDYHCGLAVALFNLWECIDEDSEEEGQRSLREAYTEAQRLTERGHEIGSYGLHYAGRIFVETADSDDLGMTLPEKIALFRKGISYLDRVAQLDGGANDFFYLGKAQETLMDHCLDLEERRDLRESAITNLRRSYELKKDQETLDLIREIEDDSF